MPKLFSIDRSLFSVQTSTHSIRLSKIFLPMYLETLFNCTLGTLHTAIISGVSEDAVGAVGASNQLIVMYTSLFSVIVMGATTVVSNYLGGSRLREARAASTAALAFAAALSLGCGLLLALFRRPVLTWMHIEARLLPLAMTYYGLRTLLLAAPTMTSVLNALMHCHGVTRPAVYSGLLSNAVNLAGSLFSVTALRGSLPTVILGISVSCVAGQLCGLLCSLLLFRRHRIPLGRPASAAAWRHYVAAMLKVGVPGGMSTMGYTISQTVTTSFVGMLGPMYHSAKVYFSNVTFYCCMFSSSLGNANAVLVGYLCGGRQYDRAAALCRQLTRITSAANLLLSCLLLLFRRPVLSIFTSQEEVLAMALTVFAIDIVVEQARAVSQIYEYGLRSTGDTFFSMVGILASCWVNGVGVAYLLGIRLGLGLPGIWVGFALDETCRAAVTYGRWRSGRWRQINQRMTAAGRPAHPADNRRG